MKKIEQIKKLFYAYSPLKSNQQLIKDYINITYDSIDPKSNIRELYNEIIFSEFLNETVIKSNFVSKFCFNKSPRNTITIFELNSFNSRADICVVNGNSEVFEIKTIYDTFLRLDDQLHDYSLLYDYINIIIPREKVQEALGVLPEYAGLIMYYKNRLGNITFKKIKKPSINNEISAVAQLSQLTKRELLKLGNFYNRNQTNKEQIIDEIIAKYTPCEINDIFKSYIKNKYREQWLYLYNNYEKIYKLDYQWFFKNNISYKLVYK
ncbi:MAG: sce7726 family protein [Acholeplasmataceae bacterium]